MVQEAIVDSHWLLVIHIIRSSGIYACHWDTSMGVSMLWIIGEIYKICMTAKWNCSCIYMYTYRRQTDQIITSYNGRSLPQWLQVITMPCLESKVKDSDAIVQSEIDRTFFSHHLTPIHRYHTRWTASSLKPSVRNSNTIQEINSISIFLPEKAFHSAFCCDTRKNFHCVEVLHNVLSE